MQKVPFDGWVSRNQLVLMYPRDASNVSLSAGVSWSWSAQSQIVASSSEDFVPTHLNVLLRIGAKTDTNQIIIIEHEIATGAATSEAPYATNTYLSEKLIVDTGASTQALSNIGITVPIGPTVIPSGTRIAHRARTSLAAADITVGVNAYIAGYQAGAVPARYPMYSYRGHHAGIHKSISKQIPIAGATLPIVESTWASGYGAWSEVIASAESDLFIWSIGKEILSSSNQASYFEIGVGAATSEVPIGRLGSPGAVYMNSHMQYFIVPLLIKAGERVAIRHKGATTSGQTVVVNYEEL